MNELNNRSDGDKQGKVPRRSRSLVWTAAATVIAAGVIAGYVTDFHAGSPAAAATAAPQAHVTVSNPLQRDIDTQLGFLGQFSPVSRVELRAQVGGTLTQIHFKDGDIVNKGDLLFSIEQRPYEIQLAKATAQLQAATARLALADRELYRAQQLRHNNYGTDEDVDQRTSDQRSAQASIDGAKAQINDAQFDIEHCRITAPFTGRIGAHLVSEGSLIAGSRAAASPTTLLATLVSLDPIYLDFDMSEADYLTFSHYRTLQKGGLAEKVDVTLSDGTRLPQQGVLDFVDNVLDRSSGTLHARATVPNPGLLLTPGEFARLRLVVSVPTATLLVPDTAVLPDQSQHVVMTVSADGTVVPKLVELGDRRGGLRVIRSGLTPTDRVIIDGLVYAAPGSKVATQDGAIQFVTAAGQN